MVIALLAALIGVQIAGFAAVGILLPAWVRRQKREIYDQIAAFTASTGDQPSPLAILTDQIATLFAARVWQQVESRLRGAAGTAVREGNREAEAEIAGSGPLAALAMAFLPKKAKMMMMKNPQFLGSLGSLFGPRSNAGSNNGPAKQQSFSMEM